MHSSFYALLLLGALAVTSCGNDEQPDGPTGPVSLVGTWDIVSGQTNDYYYRSSDKPLITWVESYSIPRETDLTISFEAEPNLIGVSGRVTFETLTTNNRGLSQTSQNISPFMNYLKGASWEMAKDSLRFTISENTRLDFTVDRLTKQELQISFEWEELTGQTSQQDTSRYIGTYLFARQ